jgi:hypothetical protein
LNQAIPVTTEEIDKIMDNTLKSNYNYTSLLEQNATTASFGNVSRKTLIDAMVNTRQHEICLKILLNDIITCAKNVESLQLQLAQRLDKIKVTVQSKTAIPTAQVYVRFNSFDSLNFNYY